MQHNAISIRPFIGAKNFETSRNFYRDLGFVESEISNNMSLFQTGKIGFYLQDYYAEEWINNTMVFMEVDDTIRYHAELVALRLAEKYKVKLSGVKTETWGKECFLHDPSGVLWHFGEFFNR